jgi:CheY-like chemotaxis protein
LNKHILVVDDEKIMRDLLCRSLRPTGCHVILAEDGLAGLDKLEANNIDVLISDIRMPKMDGITFVREALKRQPNLAALLITGYSDILTRREALELGVADVIMKPFKNVDIIHSLRKALAICAKRRERPGD